VTTAEIQRPKTEKPIDFASVKRVLVVKLRSIGDTVLATPSLRALRRFLPNAQIDILLEDWVAPLLEGHEDVDYVIRVGRGTVDRLKVAARLATSGYDVAFNLHGGTTATFFTAASRGKHRVGFANYQYSFVYNHLLSSASDFWSCEKTHSAEQQLALLGFVGVPVADRPKSNLSVSKKASVDIASILHAYGVDEERIALIHPASAFETKAWPAERFAKTIDYLAANGIFSIAVAAPNEEKLLDGVAESTSTLFHGLTDLSLTEVTALADRAEIFVGNDSGIAHIAAAVGTPVVVIFGSSNRAHWSPWTDAPHEVVYEHFDCQPCAGYECKVFGEPRCILSVTPEAVIGAISRLLPGTQASSPATPVPPA
jgi:heptosyltransferase-3